MKQTLLTRIKKAEQYDISKKTVLWVDHTESRWNNDYGKLVLGDQIIFIGADKLKNKLLIGTIIEINNKDSILCNNIEEVNCSNDQLLQLHEIYPELISRVKANFQPFIHPLEINISQLIYDANNKNFHSYYIINGKTKYNEVSASLKVNDRVILLNSINQFENAKTHSAAGLNDFNEALNISISVQGLTLDEVLEKNKKIIRESSKSNNVARIQNIKSEIAKNGIYKFNTFFSYYDALYNKKVYGDGVTPAITTTKIKLKTNETVYKVSMSSKDINNEAFNYFIDNEIIVVHSLTKAKATSHVSQGDIFSKLMKIGDYFYMCRGNSNVEIIGKLSSDSEVCEYKEYGDDGWIQRSYEIIAESKKDGSYHGDKKWWTPNDNSTCIAIPKNEIIDANLKLFIPFFNTHFVYEEEKISSVYSTNLQYKTLNQILYGPPGTGKTYNTINKALAILGLGEEIKGKTREEIKALYDVKVKEGQIVFTTFHQSMCYEDFIEGIKPLKPNQEDNYLKYDILPGIFKKLCQDAKTPNLVGFDSAFEKLKDELANSDLLSLKTPTGREFSISLNSNDNLTLHTGTNKEKQGTLTKENIQKQINGEEKFKGWEGYFKGVIDYLKQKYQYSEKELISEKKYVLIIDEINRGNISQIFGELITLIEDDKRMGKDEALEITLPYSKEKFSVPSNVYIIGTMNTADRSVEALDTALRRRFSFEEMMPKPELIATDGKLKDSKGVLDTIDLPLLLSTINRRVEKLLDRDHQIGHSYFMSVENLEELKIVFQNKIIPLLQEYFFGDYGKIGLVIGEGFVRQKESSEENIFAMFEDYDGAEFAERKSYTLANVRDMADEDFKFATNLLMKK